MQAQTDEEALENITLKMEADNFECNEANPPEEYDDGDSTSSWDKYKSSSTKNDSRTRRTSVCSATPKFAPRKQSTRLATLKHFEIIGDLCKCLECGNIMKGDRTFNLNHHLERRHNIKMGSFYQRNKKKKPAEVEKNIKVEIARIAFFKACIGLVTDDDLPLKVFNSSNLRTILDPICDGLSLHEKQIRLNDKNVCNTISLVANNIQQSIKSELKSRLLSLKVDSATMLGGSSFTISAQFVANDQIESFMLGIIQFDKNEELQPHALADNILKILERFDVATDQVVSITSDNGANIFKAKLKERHGEETNKAYLQNVQAYKIFNEFLIILGLLQHRRFVAHTSQLCALDITCNSVFKPYLMQCRNLTKFIKKSSDYFREIFEEKRLRLPVLDCAAHWVSTYSMISDLHNAKDILSKVESIVNKSEDENFCLNLSFWKFIEAYVQVFAPLQRTVVKFQEELLNYGDFYACWLKCKLMTQRVLSSDEKKCDSKVKVLTNSLLTSVEAREQKLLDNDELNASLFLDPRFHHLLNPERKLKATEFLLKLWEQLKKNNPEIHKMDQKAISSVAQIMPSVSSDEDDETQMLNSFLFQGMCTKSNQENHDLRTKIQQFNPTFSGSNTNIFEFWKSKKKVHPELYALAQVCFGIPATQVTTEWPSSSIELFKSYFSNELTYSQLQDILFVKLNKDFIDEGIDSIYFFD